MQAKKKTLILIELNEINFDVVQDYISAEPNRFPGLKKLLDCHRIRTSSETEYEQLEPWIQWVSVHTGKTYDEHRVFRLGDIVDSKQPQIFEQLEQAGHRVGVISAMNAENRLKDPAYFVPDPWTKTASDQSWWSKALTSSIAQVVNENSSAKISPISFAKLALGLVRFARPKHYAQYLRLVAKSVVKPWNKAMLLDLFLHDFHWHMLRSKRADFSTLFLNAGAHIQHHYFFNAAPLKGKLSRQNPAWYVGFEDDPVADLLELYDLIVSEYLTLDSAELIVATGLTQVPYIQTKFYYRLKDHCGFVDNLGIEYSTIHPRMSRDFLIEFDSEEGAAKAKATLAAVQVVNSDEPLFGEIEDRGDSLFVTMTYPHEINAETKFIADNTVRPLAQFVSFVAVKNGMHHAEGYAFFTPGTREHAPADLAHVSHLADSITGYFGESNTNSIATLSVSRP